MAQGLETVYGQICEGCVIAWGNPSYIHVLSMHLSENPMTAERARMGLACLTRLTMLTFVTKPAFPGPCTLKRFGVLLSVMRGLVAHYFLLIIPYE